MFHLKAPQTFALLLGVLVLLAAENHGFAPQHVEQKLTSNDFGITELALSLAVNQMAVLKILNESSTICSLYERQQQKMLELDVTAEELKNELQNMKKTALNELQREKTATLNEIYLKNEEAQQGLQDLKEESLIELQKTKEATLNELRQQGTTRRKIYRKYDAAATQPQALQACDQLGGRLALPTNSEEEEQLRRELGFSYPSDVWAVFYWISGTKQNAGNWIDSITKEPLRHTNFGEGQPDNRDGSQNCINVSSSFLGWDDRQCWHSATGYVCEFTNE